MLLRTCIAICACVLLHCLCAPGCVVAQDKPATPAKETFKVLREWRGFDSAIDAREYDLLTNATDYAALWKRHGQAKAAPEVDFKKEMLLAVFAGAAFKDEIKLKQILTGLRYVLRLSFGKYDASNPEKLVRPYAMFVFPKSEAPITLEDEPPFETGKQSRFAELKTFQPNGRSPEPNGWWPVKQWVGPNSKLGNDDGITDVVCLSADDEWKKLWQAHKPDDDTPAKEGGVVIGVFGGRTRNSRGMALVDVLIDEKTILIRYRNDVDWTRESTTFRKPFGIFALPPHDDPNQPEFDVLFEEFDLYKLDDTGKSVRRKDDDPTCFVGIKQERVYVGEYKPAK
jgi:hypothetical protein